MLTDQIVFTVDLNELMGDDLLPVSMDYTVNAGPRNWLTTLPRPVVGQWVTVHSDDDQVVYYAKVVKEISDRDYVVQVSWESSSTMPRMRIARSLIACGRQVQ